MVNGLISAIQRFSIDDGPGIRTTVFLKGCPLRCVWCHNPETQSSVSEVWKKKTAFGVEEEIVGESFTPEEVLAEVIKDQEYYRQTGGGLTLSGGEPLAQIDFTTSLLVAAKEKGLHTCLETSGYTKQANLSCVLPWVDLFLFDYKATTQEKHRQFTGQGNKVILENLDYLYQQGADIVLRCPLVPGVNDSADHLTGISKISKQYPKLRGVEIMPYHNMGEAKTLALGKRPALSGVEPPTDAIKKRWLDQLKKQGCEKILMR